MFPIVIFTEFFLWSCTHGTVGLMQMRGVNQPKEKSESANSNEDNPCSISRSRRRLASQEAWDTEERPFRMLKVLLIETRRINRIRLSLGRNNKVNHEILMSSDK